MDAPLHDTTSVIVAAPEASGLLRVDIAWPPSHPRIRPLPDDQPLPLMLVLDADLIFPIVAGLSRIAMIADVGPHLVAGIGYPDGAAFERLIERRMFDCSFDRAGLAPGPGLPRLPGGGGAGLLAALRGPVLAAIGAHRPIDRTKVCLYGSSASGLFTANALLRDRGRTFTGVAIQSGAFRTDDGRTLAQLTSLAASDLVPGFRAFVSVGRAEQPAMQSDTISLIHAWTEARIPVDAHVLDGETHMSIVGPSYTRALRWFLPPKESSVETPARGHNQAP